MTHETDLVRVNVYLFSIAVPLHLIWEVAQIGAYDFPDYQVMTDIIGCFIPSLGDGLMTLMIYWAGWLFFRSPRWVLDPGWKRYGFLISAGVALAVAVELNALYRTGAWSYSEQMIRIPILEVGLLPILQMILLPPLTVVLLQQFWKKGNGASTIE